MKFLPKFLFDESKDITGGGSAPPDPSKQMADLIATKKQMADLIATNSTLLARLEALEKRGGGSAPPKEDPDLTEKARRQRELDQKKTGDVRALEAALRFNIDAPNFLKNNAALLPKDITDIFKAADAEKFETAIEKDAAIKAGIIQSFFAVQSNLDLLTPGLKASLEDYLKLTKNGKQEKAQAIYDSIFEPAFDTLRRVKKAEALNKGFGNPGGSEDAYKNRMMSLSKKHYLGEKA